MAKKPAEVLKKLAMPEKKMAESEAELDLEGLGEEYPEGEEKAASDMKENAGEEGEPTDMEMEEGGALAECTDEDLIKELRKRGLIDDAEEKKIEAELQE
jgi:hypothetical protein